MHILRPHKRRASIQVSVSGIGKLTSRHLALMNSVFYEELHYFKTPLKKGAPAHTNSVVVSVIAGKRIVGMIMIIFYPKATSIEELYRRSGLKSHASNLAFREDRPGAVFKSLCILREYREFCLVGNLRVRLSSMLLLTAEQIARGLGAEFCCAIALKGKSHALFMRHDYLFGKQRINLLGNHFGYFVYKKLDSSANTTV